MTTEIVNSCNCGCGSVVRVGQLFMVGHNRRGAVPWHRRKINAAGELWCKNCKTYHIKSEFSPQGEFYHQSCRRSRNDAKRKSIFTEGHCALCNSPFQRYTQQSRKYCSKGCKSKATDIKNSKAVAICPTCGKEFARPARFKAKHCSRACGYIDRRRDPAKALARGKRGSDWLKQRELARQRDGNICMACGLVGGKYDVDHIVPYRLMVQWNLEANALVNLLTTCDTCHARKTNTEVRLLKGDVVGFKRELFRVNYPEDRVRAAFAFAGIKW